MASNGNRSMSFERLDDRTMLTTMTPITLITIPPADNHPDGVGAFVQNMPEAAFQGLANASFRSDFVVIIAIE